MIVIYTVFSHVDALIINSLLHNSGVNSVLLDYNHATLQSHMILAIGIRIYIPDEQKDIATAVIEEYIQKKRNRPPFNRVKSSKKIEEICPQCESRHIRTEGYPRQIPSMVLSLCFGVPFVIRCKVCVCQDCGTFWKKKKR